MARPFMSAAPPLALFDPEAIVCYRTKDRPHRCGQRRGAHRTICFHPPSPRFGSIPTPADDHLWVERYILELAGTIYPIHVFIGRDAPAFGDAFYNVRAGLWIGSRMGSPRTEDS